MHLRDWLEKEGLTQEALGQLMVPPISQGKVSHWLNGTRRVSLTEGIQLLQITRNEVQLPELAAMYRPQRPTPLALPPATGQHAEQMQEG